MHTISQQGLDLIKKFEGFSAEAYFCPAGKRTIGFGHVIAGHEAFSEPFTRECAENILKQDVSAAEQAVRRRVAVALTQGQFDALVSFVFNVGEKAFENSTLLRFLNAGDPDKAAAQFSRWVYAAGRKLSGLEARRAAEAQLFQS